MQATAPERILSRGPEETRALAAALAARLPARAVVALEGELGAGKTCFVQGLAAAFGIATPVSSPSYALVNEYAGSRRIVHFDLFRVGGAEEILQLGWEEYLEEEGAILAVEWAERAGALIPPGAWHVRIEHADEETHRWVTVIPGGAA